MDDRFTRWLPEGLKGAELHEPSPGALRRAIALGADLELPATGWVTRILFDSLEEPVAAGMRHAPGKDRRLLLRIQGPGSDGVDHQLDLQLRLGSDDFVGLTGQILPPWPNAELQAVSGRLRQSRPLGPSGEFLIRKAGRSNRPIMLQIETGDGHPIALPTLRIGADPSHDS